MQRQTKPQDLSPSAPALHVRGAGPWITLASIAAMAAACNVTTTEPLQNDDGPSAVSSGAGGATAGPGGSAPAGSGGTGGMTGTGGGTVQPDGCTDKPASDVSMGDVDFFQVVQIPLYADGEGVDTDDRNAPIVAHRDGIIRAHFALGTDFASREIALRVTVDNGGTVETFLDRKTPIASSSPSDPDSGFLVELPGSVLASGASYSVGIVECDADTAGPWSTALYPAEGLAALGPEETGTIKIHLVPYEIGGFVPDTSQAVLDGFRDRVLSVYPVADVQFTVGDVVPDSSGGNLDMDGLLVNTGVLSESEGMANDVYYYGLVTGAATRAEFCDSCPTGTSENGVANNGAVYRAGFAIGAAFADEKAEDTLIHELGHLHLLEHAPCNNPSNIDPYFPYANAEITMEGYDFRTESFVPSTDKDMMSYCYPRWVSDYHYAKLADWVSWAATDQWGSVPMLGGNGNAAMAQSGTAVALPQAHHSCSMH